MQSGKREVAIPVQEAWLEGHLEIPLGAVGVVLFAHGSGSGRFSPRNNYVAEVLQEAGIATLLFDLLTREEDQVYQTRFDIALLTERLETATAWLKRQPDTAALPVGYFGASTGAAAALRAAAHQGADIAAVVSRGGRPDLAGAAALAQVHSPTLLLVGELDIEVIRLNQEAQAHMHCPTSLVIVPGATHLFEEPGTLTEVANHAAQWLRAHLSPHGAPSP
ncbi:dienelactone hydrolase family protein [Pseudogulbenkiania subflava]|uniref:Dienelactone hydrolase n=1 Tax=Pseudogulbenkiania subflava DSM 22618 TaxID=1123014 RepID=A0A1Y6C7U4_9NEIS|nr:alpha/beta family hydrolase [Pseudogulbenkiania subflava]SMF41305.1 Dienelactone hydrolase [Pseudogulbenkiania subflava DSM 22618]